MYSCAWYHMLSFVPGFCSALHFWDTFLLLYLARVYFHCCIVFHRMNLYTVSFNCFGHLSVYSWAILQIVVFWFTTPYFCGYVLRIRYGKESDATERMNWTDGNIDFTTTMQFSKIAAPNFIPALLPIFHIVSSVWTILVSM